MRLTYDAKTIRLPQACRAHNGVRYYLNAILLDKDGSVVGTDGHRLAVCPSGRQLEKQYLVDFDIPIPKTATQVVFDFERMVIEVHGRKYKEGPLKLNDATYPDWKRVLPSGHTKPTEVIGFYARYLADIALFGDYGKLGAVKLSLFGCNDKILVEPVETFKQEDGSVAPVWPEGTKMVIMPMKLPT